MQVVYDSKNPKKIELNGKYNLFISVKINFYCSLKVSVFDIKTGQNYVEEREGIQKQIISFKREIMLKEVYSTNFVINDDFLREEVISELEKRYKNNFTLIELEIQSYQILKE